MPLDDVQPSTVETRLPSRPVRHEFDEFENRVFADLARKARGVGGWFILFGVVTILGLVRAPSLAGLIAGLVLVMVGVWSRRAALGFDAVARTEGGDLGHLMAALRELAKLYGLLDRIILIAVVFTGLILIGGLLASLLSPAVRP
jgi:hypothetical protein